VLWWAIFYIIFVGINILGIEITMRFTVVITVAALGILAFFFVAVLVTRSFDASLLTNIPPEPGGSSFLPKGIAGIFPALPFAIWFYLAIEERPLRSLTIRRKTSPGRRSGGSPPWSCSLFSPCS
jgi:ethanolamine permease